MDHTLLEVIACSLEDAVEAEAGGADRLELVSGRDIGGLTPAIALVRRIKAQLALPLRVMVRQGVGFAVGDDIESLCETAQELNEIGIDGLVTGFLRNGALDKQTLGSVLSCAPRLKATFHHAFEAADDKEQLIQELKMFPQIDRILAHGGEGSWSDKLQRLISYQRAAAPEIEILVGGGLNKPAISLIRENSDLREFHVGSAAREDGKVKQSVVSDLCLTLRNR
jgi:copper homeostasis protein